MDYGAARHLTKLPRRQIVQQLGMRRRLAGMAEVARGRHQRLAEKDGPDAIDHDSRGKWIAAARDRFGQFLATAAVFERGRFAG